MNPVGVCTWIWVSPYTDDNVGLVGRARELGGDVLEVCIEDTDVSADALLEAAGDSGLAFSVCGAFGPERDLSHDDPHYRRLGIDYAKLLVDFAVAINAPNIVGPMYSAVGKTRLLPREERERQRDWAVEGLREVADYAGERGVRLAIEPINRFETDLINTTEQALDLCARIGRDNVGLLLDTFHMSIEEKSIPGAIRLAGDHLFHVHSCENDRGTPGTGQVPWTEVLSALEEIAYDGQLVIESFTPDVHEIAKAASIWRPLDAAGDELARRGVEYLKSAMHASDA
jgi:D-psicose/D-tagatose/L-ribulose 3-epimerase